METLYDVLGARPDDDAESLKRAYHKAVKANHPDRHAGDPDAVVRFRRITTAYDTLRDSKRRAAYDRLLEHQRGPLGSKARHAPSRPARQFVFNVIVGVVIGIGLAGAGHLLTRIYGIAGVVADGMTAGLPSRMIAVEPVRRADTSNHQAEPSEQPQSAEPKTATISQEEICKRDAAQLAHLRISQEPDDIIRFERELHCEKLRPQVIRLRESVDFQ
jgi:curved DNA-binding protein CbpA